LALAFLSEEGSASTYNKEEQQKGGGGGGGGVGGWWGVVCFGGGLGGLVGGEFGEGLGGRGGGLSACHSFPFPDLLRCLAVPSAKSARLCSRKKTGEEKTLQQRDQCIDLLALWSRGSSLPENPIFSGSTSVPRSWCWPLRFENKRPGRTLGKRLEPGKEGGSCGKAEAHLGAVWDKEAEMGLWSRLRALRRMHIIVQDPYKLYKKERRERKKSVRKGQGTKKKT